MIALIDYGAGNLTSVRKALAAVGAQVWTPSVPGELGRAHGIVVPGVGHFDSTKQLTEDWRTAIKTMVGDGVPLLGICVGLQWLFEGSDEASSTDGICMFKGKCFHFADRLSSPQAPRPLGPQVVRPSSLFGTQTSRPQDLKTPRPLKVPHVGWNSVWMPKLSRLMAGIKDGTQVYFTHSYAAPVIEDTVAMCEYGVSFSAALERDNVAAVQFHPEKSGDAGLRILNNWVANVK